MRRVPRADTGESACLPPPRSRPGQGGRPHTQLRWAVGNLGSHAVSRSVENFAPLQPSLLAGQSAEFRVRPRPRTSAPSALRLPNHQVSVPNPYISSRCKSSRSHQRPRHHSLHQAERILHHRFVPFEFAPQGWHGCFAWRIVAVRTRQSLDSMYTPAIGILTFAIVILFAHSHHHLRLLRPF